ncbi:hypothetical protein CNMCM5623_006926 [Aspergillus felis]|uniref:Uncharacterized protein n=1 Tax=Aspergillus felis TaxID=1287682 RepID=A0A8H6QIN8_9EURO|nr:hypothetical protein CNMCM5623_006926 [Aspergillus felis]
MPDETQLTFTGDWRITVTGRDATWPQRVVASGTAAGTQTLAGNPSTTLDVYGNGQAAWTLSIDHNDGSHGWQPSFIRGNMTVSGPYLSWMVESEDNTTPSSDRDFNDLVIRLDKMGMVGQSVSPFAVLPGTLQAMPEGVFEATLGRYLMAVRIQNIWTMAWPATAGVGLSDRCRAWLSAAGVSVIDSWTLKDQEVLGQQVVGGRVVVGALGPWETRRIFFKIDVSQAAVRKHQVELQVMTDHGAEGIALMNKAARAPISVTRTTYNQSQQSFVSRCDIGVMTASIKRMTIDLTTFRRAIAIARQLGIGGTGGGGGSGGGSRDCDRRTSEFVRAQLQDFLDGKEVNLCALWRRLACCCASGGGDGGKDEGGDWTDTLDAGLTFFLFPTEIDYSVEYNQPFHGQFGPIPFQDPWWKILLVIIAILLTIAEAVSGGADLANSSDSAVIGTVTRSVLNALKTQPTANTTSTDPGSVDAAVVTLNGRRGLTPAIFTVLDAASDEASANPI